MAKPLPCIACGTQPEPIGGQDADSAWTPYAATMFDAGAGHYGSTVWDTMSGYRSLAVNVCDKCLIERKDRVGVFETVPVPNEVTLVAWDPES